MYITYTPFAMFSILCKSHFLGKCLEWKGPAALTKFFKSLWGIGTGVSRPIWDSCPSTLLTRTILHIRLLRRIWSGFFYSPMLLMMTQDRLDSEKSIGFHRYIRLRHLWNSKLTSDFCWFGYVLTSLNWVWFFRLFVPPCEFFTLRLVPKWVIHSSATTRIKSLTPTGCKILVACYSCSHKRSVFLNVKDKTEFFSLKFMPLKIELLHFQVTNGCL